jgi:GT2 family glycosyltransferase
MNVGLTAGTGALVAKVDAHGYPAHDFVRRAVEAFEECEPDVACVGGRPEQTGETAWGKAVALARTSRFGVGGSVYAGATTREFVDTVQCGVYRRGALEAVGGFDPSMAFGEDDELNWRLRKAGYRILLDTSVRFVYITRSSLRALFRQYRNYGRAKVRVIAAHPGLARPWHFAPALALFGAIAAVVLAAAGSRAALIALASGGAAYVLAAGAAAVLRAGTASGLASVARVCACFGAIHSGYGVGMIEGAVRAAGGRLVVRR